MKVQIRKAREGGFAVTIANGDGYARIAHDPQSIAEACRKAMEILNWSDGQLRKVLDADPDRP